MSTRRMPKHERRAQILDVATEQFSVHGFHGTSMEEIARAAGATKPVVYQHFDSKEELFIAVLDARAAVVLGAMDLLQDRPGSSKERVEAGLRGFHRLTSGSSPLLLFVGGEAVSEDVRDHVAALLDQMASKISRVVLSYRTMSEAEALVVGRVLIGLAQQSARLVGQDPSPEHEQLTLDVVARLITSGLSGFDLAPGRPPQDAEPR